MKIVSFFTDQTIVNSFQKHIFVLNVDYLFHCRFRSALLTECMVNLKWGPGKLYNLQKDCYIYLLQPDISVILFNISVE